MPDFVFSKKTGNYRYKASGHAVPPERISGWIERAAEQMERDLARHAEDLRAGRINDAEWALRSTEAIKNGHRAVAVIAGGGKANMAASDWGFLGATIRRELSYFNRFANEVEARPEGAQLADAFVSRAKSYGAAIYSTFEQQQRRRVLKDGTHAFERNILEGGRQHCDGCLRETSRGKVGVGELIPVGERDCGTRCRCRIEYSN
ncbi:MAG: hypothetical protein AB7U82_27920 [Blastocatellales bacterium]